MIFDERAPEEPDPPPEGQTEPSEDTAVEGSELDVEGLLGPKDAPPELVKTFWSLVLLFNVGILATALGAMFVFFRDEVTIGGGLLVIGVLALAVGIKRYLAVDPDAFGTDHGGS